MDFYFKKRLSKNVNKKSDNLSGSSDFLLITDLLNLKNLVNLEGITLVALIFTFLIKNTEGS
jgi:hypothetical protein